MATNLAAYATASGVASTLKLIPGIGTISGAIIMSAAQYAITLTSGYVYLQALKTLAEKNGGKIDTAQLGNAIEDVLKNKTVIKDFIEAAKKDYKSK